MWSIEREVEEAVRHRNLNMSGASFLADLTLRLARDPAVIGVEFSSAVDDPEANPFISSVEQGVRGFAARWEREGRPIGQLRVALISIAVHPVDQKAHRYAEAADIAMARAFAAGAMEL